MVATGLRFLFLSSTAWQSAAGGFWRRHGGVNCYDGHGAVDVGGGSVGNMSATECEQRCEQSATCTAVVQQVARIDWDVRTGLHCYESHGAVDIADGAGEADACAMMPLAECRAQCFIIPGCEAVAFSPATSSCCLRAQVNVRECDASSSSGEWDTHLMSAAKLPDDGSRPCYLRDQVSIADCDTTNEECDTLTRATATERRPWWQSTNFAERSIMPRHYSCGAAGGGGPQTQTQTCTLPQIRGLLDDFQRQGFSVLNIDWPVDAGPDALYEGFGARDYYSVDPLLGSDPSDNATALTEWHALVGDIHARGMRVVSDFNPSYFWTGAPAFQRALADVRRYGPARADQPTDSPARWFRWAGAEVPACRDAQVTQPADAAAGNGFVDAWVRSTAAGVDACYWGIWGNGQPAGDMASAEWRTELSSIFAFWVKEMGLDGFMLDAPVDYLGSTAAGGDHYPDGNDMHQQQLARHVRQVIVDPVHALGGCVMGETYSPAYWSRPTVGKMLDGGRNTDIADGTWLGLPGRLRGLIEHGDARGLEAVLESTVDLYVGWYGAPRSEAWYDSGERGAAALQKAVLQAAATALLGGYYVTRMGTECESPHRSYGPSRPGDQWPGGCFGNWLDSYGVDTGAVAGVDGTDVRDELYATLKALPNISALHPGTPRTVIPVTATAATAAAAVAAAAVAATAAAPVYAALRVAWPDAAEKASGVGAAVLVALNLGGTAAKVSLDFEQACQAGTILCPQPAPALLIAGGGGGGGGGDIAPIVAGFGVNLEMPPLSWAVYQLSYQLSTVEGK